MNNKLYLANFSKGALMVPESRIGNENIRVELLLQVDGVHCQFRRIGEKQGFPDTPPA